MTFSRLSHRISVAILGGLLPIAPANATGEVNPTPSQEHELPLCPDAGQPVVTSDRALDELETHVRYDVELEKEIELLVEILECRTTDRVVCDRGG